MTTRPKYAVGIDLGTTYSCVGVYRNNAVEIIASEIGERTTPSYVAFSPTEGLLVGQAAKNQAVDNPKNTFFDAKRLIGREFNDREVQNDIRFLPYEVVDLNGKPCFSFDYNGEHLCRSPEQISSLVLRKMKTIAEEYLDGDVTEAVITVPAYFNDSQRQATKDAGMMAGLNVLRVINEPTAAAISYGLGLGYNEANISEAQQDKIDVKDTINEPMKIKYSTTEDDEKTVLVFDLGGGTFDVSILVVSGTFFEVLATSGNTHLGGEDFDSIIMGYFLEQFYRQHKQILAPILDKTTLPSSANEKISNSIVLKLTTLLSSRGLRRLRTACEFIKRSLSYKTIDGVEIEELYEGLTLNATLSRSKFEDLCCDYFTSCLDTIKNVLQEKKILPSQIDDIILVGGSTRIPKIRTMLADYFQKTINTSINPDEAVAFGAAIQASILSTHAINARHEAQSSTIDDDSIVTLVDVAPLSLGIETVGNTMSTFIKRNSSIPISETKYYTTDRDFQKQVEIRIFEGERPSTLDNHFLGNVILKVPEMPAGVPRVAVTFELDQNGLLVVSALEETSKTTCSIAITNDRGTARLTDEDLKRLIGESEEFIKQDKQFRQKRRQRMEIEAFIRQVEGALDVFRKPIKPIEIPGLSLNIGTVSDQPILLTSSLENQIGTSLADFKAWYEVNEGDATTEELSVKKDKFMNKMDSLLEPLFKEYLKLGGDPYPNGIVNGIGKKPQS